VPAWPGSLRACINYANTNPGTTIEFDIPDTEPGYVTFGAQSWWRLSPDSPLPAVTASGTVIDGTTQAVNYGSDTNSLGPEIEIVGTGAGTTDGIVITGGSGTIRGLVVNQFSDDGIVFSTSDGNAVQECYIGIDPTGTLDRGNGDHGIIVRDGSDNNTIGAPGAGNVISGNGDRGVRILSSSGNVIQGNLIGTDASGTGSLGNSAWGVHLQGASGNAIGGQNAGEENVIAFNGRDGVAIIGAGANQNSILGNAIHSNNSMGIDLNDDGVTANNGTTGFQPNIGMDYPVLTAAALTLSSLRVEGYVGTSALKIAGTHTIEVFKADDDGDSNGEVESGDGRSVGHGEGRWFIDRCSGAADGTFVCNLTVPGTVSLASGDFVTATATDTSGNSSEFGANLIVTPNTCPIVTNTADSGGGSLRACIDYANLNPGTSISFNIANSDPGYTVSGGNAWWRISPTSTLPDITGAGTIIDGSTQAANYGVDTNSLGPEIEIEGTNAGNNKDGLIITGGGTTIRDLVINRFDADGIILDDTGGNVVEGCYIGLDPTGTSALPNNSDGIVIESGSDNNLIGGTGAGARNIISGNGASGINLASSDGNIIHGNLIGTDPSGAAGLGNTDHGVLVSGAVESVVGGQGAGEGNIIAFNGLDGLFVTGGGAAQNQISGNSIFSNTDLGIDLAPNGVGTGGKQAPVISSVADTGGGNTAVTVTTDPGDVVEFFRVGNTAAPAVAPDPTGSGEGFLYLGACADDGLCSGPYMVSASDGDGAGGTVQAILLGTAISMGDYVTATATDALSETSEFAINATYSLMLVKQAILAADGSLITNSSVLPRGTVFKFLIYTENTGPARTDVSIRDVLDAAFAYSTGSLKADNSVATGATVGAIYAAVNAASPLTDGVDGDVASVSGSTIDVGNQNAANGQLDIAADRVWALLFTVRMQ
jgi:titin